MAYMKEMEHGFEKKLTNFTYMVIWWNRGAFCNPYVLKKNLWVFFFKSCLQLCSSALAVSSHYQAVDMEVIYLVFIKFIQG